MKRKLTDNFAGDIDTKIGCFGILFLFGIWLISFIAALAVPVCIVLATLRYFGVI